MTSENKKSRIIRSKSGEVIVPYTQIYDHILEDKRIGSVAFRIIVYMASKGNWTFYRSEIRKRLGLGRTSFKRAIRELYLCGYVEYKDYELGDTNMEVTYYQRPDRNLKFVNGVNDHEERKIEYSELLNEVREEERKAEEKQIESINKKSNENFAATEQEKKNTRKKNSTNNISHKKSGSSKNKKHQDNAGDFDLSEFD